MEGKREESGCGYTGARCGVFLVNAMLCVLTASVWVLWLSYCAVDVEDAFTGSIRVEGTGDLSIMFSPTAKEYTVISKSKG